MTAYATTPTGARIAYTAEGEGPRVIHVDGAFQFRAFDSETRDFLSVLADRGFTTVHFDRPGRGETVAEPPHTLDRQIEAIGALIDEVGGPVALYGSSSGGAIALAAAASGLPVSHLVLWEPPLGPESGSDGAEFLAGLREAIATGDADRVVAYFMKDMPPEWLEGSRRSPAWPVMTGVAASLEGDSDALAWTQSAPRSELWRNVTAPTLVLLGEETLPIFPPAADSIVANLPDARVERVPGSDHRWELTALVERVEGFLRA
ncbi:pimeloyl-ACP methyl ester carboxylesterase [Diaminobutyricimonas aerilata]|uniref:Pimeloyl-ACP methyl ester carboxylesterase n=1 Tax=Diaminobutyricimonas aerilata TaxID=1162967 RepID=A0A2M9CJ89_9MICO|nr:alpha/beta hydrolase [Diaminobutyricimonas aerilata]PJJ71973.1 pimeloyl-ACP methyl ester carboxylesterase [Diaminobutyricimonas aerilata]